MNAKSISLVVIGVLIGAIGFLAFQLYMPKTPAAIYQQGQGQYEGFSSNEEMMAAHHGPQSSGAGCGFSEDGVPSSSKASGAMSEYGISYDQKGYEQLLKYASATLNPGQTNTIVGLDVSIPCCGFSKLQASGNCECGHHTALLGLAKLLAGKGYEKQQIQAEIDKWKEIFYPNGASGTGGC